MKHLTKSLFIVLLAVLLSLSLIGCQSTAAVDSVPEIVVPAPAPAAEAPAPAPEAEETPASAVEEVPAPAEEASSVSVTVPVVIKETGSLSFYGYTLSYEAVPGEARVTYPQFITEADVRPRRDGCHIP